MNVISALSASWLEGNKPKADRLLTLPPPEYAVYSSCVFDQSKYQKLVDDLVGEPVITTPEQYTSGKEYASGYLQ